MDSGKPAVTICHKEAYALGGLALLLSVLALVLTLTSREALLPGLAVSVLGLLLAAYGFYKARSVEHLDETGIVMQTPTRRVCCPWSRVKRVELHPPEGKDTPKLWLFPEGRKMPLRIEYTKRTYQCVTSYYGTLDSDEWGKPPVIF